MAAVEVTISGVLYDKLNRTTQNVVLIGEATLTGLGVGGGPIVPPGQPPQIWGPPDPRPNPPIAFPPGWVGGVPPQQPVDPPPTLVKPPPPGGGWAYVQEWGWGYYPGSTAAGPK